ncbi:glycosyl transferase family 2 [Motilibacter peucedani]|uniref:Glycosyl transferase family 2 n=1 Tax=Motilibacter peucedani TaxID=598650 RepID=A0A420XU01_9ACTN|nr:glycosyltransferase family 2 protein [Motilibacter peucedani]RKS80139.1 glycosyl transferase family 2 [Motilibacter peucedani]
MLSVVLIVRDEAAALPGALRSLEPLRDAGLLDAVRVHDTGSTDATRELAGAWGAQVASGPWTGDFAAARNAALEGVSSGWVLSIDADERVEADVDALRALLTAGRADAYAVSIRNDADSGAWTHRAERLFRPAVARWEGRVHERLVARTGAGLPVADVPAGVLHLDHTGYATGEVRAAKSVRNVALAQADLDALAATPHPDPARVAQVLLDLGRSLVGADRLQEAVDAFEALRSLAPGTPQALQGTDAFARLLLGAGMDSVVLHLVGELRAGGAPRAYCDWLEAQALAQLGQVERAHDLLQGVDEVVDTAGRRHPQAQLDELRSLLRSLRARVPQPR